MKYKLFHKIGPGGDDSAEVRKFVVEKGLSKHIDFQNIGYDSAEQELIKITGKLNVPCLIAGDQVITGKDAVIKFLSALP